MSNQSSGDKIVEWEVTMKCNYRCAYCTNLDPELQPIQDREQIRNFVSFLGTEYPGTEIFVFGGEPFLHPDFGYIVQCFNELEVPYVIQTNFSKKSVKEMERIQQPMSINISIHPTEVKLETVVELFQRDLPHVRFKTIDIMYVGPESIKYYLAIKKVFSRYEHMFLTPVTDFGDGHSNTHLADFNEKRTSSLLNKIIDFEQVQKYGEYRSVLWANKDFVTLGKPCLYTDRYFLYGPDLSLYNCCYRENHTGICQQQKCFLM
jgi:organic radical activating enzyme